MNGGRISRHEPQRTCVGCSRVKAKRELLRLVVAQGGRIAVDWDQKSPGRGVYLCAQRECWERGLKRDRIGHFLRTKLNLDNREGLMAMAVNLVSQGDALGQQARRAPIQSGLE
ncbi:MAG: YlxR family protein [Dehalococcoidia bacterium]|nr:YlxR family protein [Dehalococcoidia bacterium]